MNIYSDNDTSTTSSFPSQNVSLYGSLPPDMLFNSAHVVSISGYSTLFVISASANLSLLQVLMNRYKRNKSRVNLLLINLTIADLIVTFFTMPLEIGWAATVMWTAGDVMCRVCSFFRIFGLFLSGNIIISISVDRFYAIVYPFETHSSSNKTKFFIILAWVVAAISSLPQIYVFHVETHPQFKFYTQCVTFNSFPSPAFETAYTVFGVTMMYIIPLFVIVITYSVILFTIWRRGKAFEVRTTTTVVGGNQNIPLVAITKVGKDSVPIDDNLSTVTFDGECNSKIENFEVREGNSERGLMTSAPSSTKRKSTRRITINDDESQPSLLVPKHDCQMKLRTNSESVLNRARIRTLKMTIVMVSVFIFCWTPYYIITLWFLVDKNSFQKVDQRIQNFLFLFACTNSVMDPLVYGYFNLRLNVRQRRQNKESTIARGIHREHVNMDNRETNTKKQKSENICVSL